MKNQTEKTENSMKEANIPIGEIEMPTLDVRPYVGREVKIASVTTLETQFVDERLNKPKYSLRVVTEIVDTIGEGDNAIELTASNLYPLYWDATGENLGWAEQTKTGQFLKKMRVKNPGELIGKKVICQIRTSKKDGREYLGFA